MAEAKHDCSCELCRPNFWLGAFDESLDKEAVTHLDNRLNDEHQRKVEAARRAEAREALATG